MTGYFEWLAIQHPAVYGALVARIYPSQVSVTMEEGHKPYKSLEELHEVMLRRGLPALQIMHRVPFKPLGDDDVIDVEPQS
jgi:hypothetical protein